MIEDLESNLVHQSGNGVLESLGDIDEKVDVMSSMRFNGTLGTDGSLVSLAVGVDLKVRMLLAVKNPGADEVDPPSRASSMTMYW